MISSLSSTRRATLTLGLACLASYSAFAVPVESDPNRDVVRDGYAAYFRNFALASASPFSLPDSVLSVTGAAPILSSPMIAGGASLGATGAPMGSAGAATAIAPGSIAAASAAALSSSSGASALSSGSAAGATGYSSSSTAPLSSTAGTVPSVSVMAPATSTTGAPFTPDSAPLLPSIPSGLPSTAIAPVAADGVPDGGGTVMLMGFSLLALSLFNRRRKA